MVNSVLAFVAAAFLLSCFVLGIAFAACVALRNGSADVRHWVWVTAFATLLIVPPAARWLPDIEVSSPAVSWVERVVPSMARGSDAGVAAAPVQNGARAAPGAAAPRVAAPAGSTAEAVRAPTWFAAVSWQAAIANAYLAVSSLLLVRLLLLVLATRGRVRRLHALGDRDVDEIVTRLTSQLGIRRKVVILEDERSDTPWTWGVATAAIIVPSSFREWPRAEQANALAHELSHVYRYDFVTVLLAKVCVALYWFQPLAWLAMRNVRMEAESASDDFVVAQGAVKQRYAEQLLNLARTIRAPVAPGAAISAMVMRKQLSPRIARILNLSIRRTTMTRSARVLVVAFGLLFALPPALLRSQPAAPTAPPVTRSLPSSGSEIEVFSFAIGAGRVSRNIPQGWEPFYPGGPDGLPGGCEVGVDQAMIDAGRDNMTVRCDGPIGLFGGLQQGFSPANFRGKRVRLSAMVKSENIVDVPAPPNARDPQGRPARDAKGIGGLWLRVGGATPTLALAVDNMRERGLSGSVDWTRLDSVVDVPNEASEIRIGFWMQGRGQLWVSDVKFEEVARSVPVTAGGTQTRGGGPRNLTLE